MGLWIRLFRADKITNGWYSKKIIANKFVLFLENKINTEFLNRKIGEYDLEIFSEYSRKQAIVNVRFVNETNKNKISNIGIQIQGNQYRWCVEKSLNDADTENFFREYVSKGWFEDYKASKDKKIIRGHKTGLSKSYCRYRKNFLYQYWNIEEYSFENIWKQIVMDIKKAAEIIK